MSYKNNGERVRGISPTKLHSFAFQICSGNSREKLSRARNGLAQSDASYSKKAAFCLKAIPMHYSVVIFSHRQTLEKVLESRTRAGCLDLHFLSMALTGRTVTAVIKP